MDHDPNSPAAGQDGQMQLRRGGRWVSNTDLVAYLRCPYAWWHVDRGLISPEEVLGEEERKFLDSDNALRKKVESLAQPAPEEDLEDQFAADMKLLGIPILENEEREIFGSPDGVHTDSGALAPIVVKAHKHVRRSDKLELAFHWMLLEPYRTRTVGQRTGLLVLRRGGSPIPVEVELSDSYFEQVESLLESIREARESGVKARLCGCNVCSGPLRDRVRQQTRDGKDLTLLFEVGHGRASAFEAVGMENYEDIYRCDPKVLSRDLRAKGTHLSPVQLEQMQFHARSYEEGRAILFGPPPLVGNSFFAVDLEYNSFRPHLWLIGLYLVQGDSFEFIALWADGRRSERKNMERLGKLLSDNPDLQVLTWAGTSADLPELKKAAARNDLDHVLEGIDDRHIDLFAYARKILRLPIPELGLGEVAEFFGVPKTSHIGGGLEAQMLYDTYRSSRDSMEKAELKYELMAYNRDDLEALVETLRVIQGLPNEGAKFVAEDAGRKKRRTKKKAPTARQPAYTQSTISADELEPPSLGR